MAWFGKRFYIIIFGFILCARFFLSQPAHAQTTPIEIKPFDTAVVNSYYPDTKFPDPDVLPVAFRESNKMTFLYFDLSAIKPSFTLETATLSAYIENGVGDFAPIAISTPKNSWCKDDLTWNTKPALLYSSIAASSSALPSEVTWDITDVVGQWLVDPESNNGLVLGINTLDYERRLAGAKSKNAPRIKLTFASTDSPSEIASLSAMLSQSPVSTQSAKNSRPCKVLGAFTSNQPFRRQTLNQRMMKLFFLILPILAVGSYLLFFRTHSAPKTDTKE